MAGPIDVIQRALSALASAGLGSESPAEAYVLGYQAGWRERPPGKPWGGPKLSKQEIAEFKRIWDMPYSRLKYEKAPTMVGQGDEKQTLF